MLLRYYAMERLLERLSVSDYNDDFIIKGGMLVSSLIGVDERTTRDIDATMRGHDMSMDNAYRILAEIASIDIGDGFVFELRKPQEIMEDSEYGGVRINVSISVEKTKTAFIKASDSKSDEFKTVLECSVLVGHTETWRRRITDTSTANCAKSASTWIVEFHKASVMHDPVHDVYVKVWVG